LQDQQSPFEEQAKEQQALELTEDELLQVSGGRKAQPEEEEGTRA
jgi:hypothetical protein